MEIKYPSSGNPVIAIHTMAVASFEPGAKTDDTPASATVRLVDFMSKVPISVTDVYVEVELAQLYSTANYTGTGVLSCTVNMKYP